MCLCSTACVVDAKFGCAPERLKVTAPCLCHAVPELADRAVQRVGSVPEQHEAVLAGSQLCRYMLYSCTGTQRELLRGGLPEEREQEPICHEHFFTVCICHSGAVLN